MGITKLTGTSVADDMFVAALQGKSIQYSTPDSRTRMLNIVDIVSVLNSEQREDFLLLHEQKYCIIPEGFESEDIWTFLETRTPGQFKEFYIICSRKRETSKRVTSIFVKN